MRIITLFVIAAVVPLFGFADPVDLHLHNTGINSDGTLAPVGSVDQYYSNEDATVYVSSRDHQWVSPDDRARWVSPDLNQGRDYLGTGGRYTIDYTITVDLTNLNPASVKILGSWAADDTSEILVNGVSTGMGSSTYQEFRIFVLSGNLGLFRSGVNTIAFRCTNADGPGGLVVRFDSATAEPAPGLLPNAGTTLSIGAGGVVNSAGLARNAAVAPGSLASVFGTFPVSTALGNLAPLPYRLSGLSLEFGGVNVPLSFVSATQANVQIPWELAGQPQASMVATVGEKVSPPQSVRLADFAPGIFTMNAEGQAAAVDALSGRLSAIGSPAVAGSSIIAIYCTGLGPVLHQPPTGAAASVTELSPTLVPAAVTIGGVPAKVLFSGLAPTFVGLYQVNVEVPAGVSPGDAVPLSISIGGAVSNTANIAVR
jgi:uncharacterized protein (TIGR03437 family)